jgi:hypothetical protein
MVRPPNNDRSVGGAVCGYAPIVRHPGGVEPSNMASPRVGGAEAAYPRESPVRVPDHRFSIGGLAAQHQFPPAPVTPGNGALPIQVPGSMPPATMRRGK